MLSITNAHKSFQKNTADEHAALCGLSLHVAKAEFVTVIGSNGAGKSTLFGAVAGSFLLDHGSIVLDGENITYQKEHLRAKTIGRLFQDPKTGTAPGLTIEENLALVYAKATKRPPLFPAMKHSDRAYFRQTLSRLGMGLEDRLKTDVGQLSGGQRQALTLLIATIVPPKLLLLDEHTAALDPVTARSVTELTAEITNEHGITTLMITHNIESALEIGTRTIMMKSGRIVLDISGEERKNMTVEKLLKCYKDVTHSELSDDRILL